MHAPTSEPRRRRRQASACLFLAAFTFVLPAPAQVVPADPAARSKIHPPLLQQVGTVEVAIRLEAVPLVGLAPKGSKRLGPALSRPHQAAQLTKIRSQQNRLLAEVLQSGGREVARVSKALNAVIVSIDAAALPGLAQSLEVRSIRPLATYELHLGSTVPAIGGAIAQAAGYDGAGVKVAVLDSGIDYTHANLGGPGTEDAFAAAWGSSTSDPRNRTRDGLFPTAKVVAGHDFVGEAWPDGPLAFDDDPIDLKGHGTHVADIIAGAQGVAPGASLYAYKCCSAVSGFCSGVAILLALDAALDPNGDDDISDAVDVVNMSLGVSYGQIVDDSASAVQALTEYGVVVVCSAGNNGDKPYITGSPSIAPGAIAVAQTQVPEARAFLVTAAGASIPDGSFPIANTAALDWAPVDAEVSGLVVYGGQACSPFPAGTDFSGKIVLLDRGTCAVSAKVDHAARAGAAGVLIGNSVDGDPPSFSFGGTSDGAAFQSRPSLVLTLTDANRLKSWLTGGITASFGPSVFTPLAGSMVSTSSRGPSYSFNTIKPDIGAPGASVSAVAGSGVGVLPFAGTSGAAPMVAGAAALVLQKTPALLPHEVKARLMNTAETAITINPVSLPGAAAPITRIGAGEVRVDRALSTETVAYDAETGAASLSFGYQAIGASVQPVKFKRTLRLQNTGTTWRTYTFAASFRDPADAALGAATLSFSPKRVALGPGLSGTVQVTLSVAPSKLADWSLDSGLQGGNGEQLRFQEIDGFLTATAGTERVSIPWHILPRKTADTFIQPPQLVLPGRHADSSLRLSNVNGAAMGVVELFDLTGISPVDYPLAPSPGASLATPDLAAVGVRHLPEEDLLQFAIATHDERAHANYPAAFNVWIDVNQDGSADAVLFTTERLDFAATGQNITVRSLLNGPANETFLYTDADLNAQTSILSVSASGLGLGLGDPIDFWVEAIDSYFTRAVSDVIAGNANPMRYTLGSPRFSSGGTVHDIPARATVVVPVKLDPTAAALSPSHQGFLGIHRNAKPGAGFQVIPVRTN